MAHPALTPSPGPQVPPSDPPLLWEEPSLSHPLPSGEGAERQLEDWELEGELGGDGAEEDGVGEERAVKPKKGVGFLEELGVAGVATGTFDSLAELERIIEEQHRQASLGLLA